MNKDLSDTRVRVRNICMMNTIAYNKRERAFVSNSNPSIGVILDDGECYSIRNDECYKVLTEDDIKSNKIDKSESKQYAYVFNFPFEDIDKQIDLEYLIEEVKSNKKTIKNINIFDVNKICEFKYRLYKKYKKSYGFINYTDDSVYDIESKKKIDSEDICYKTIPEKNSKELISLNEMEKKLRLRQKKTK